LGYEIAKELNLPLDVVVPRKVGAPGNEEFAVGAITEQGDYVPNPDAGHISEKHLEKEIEKEKKEAGRRLKLYRPGMGDRDFKNKVIILVDDGIATGLTMEAGIKTLKSMGAKEIIIAVPVSAEDSQKRLHRQVDRIICLDIPMFFASVGQFYEKFDQTKDEEVIDLMKKAN
jgi:putative phosphoribosyl transferase